LPARPRFTDSAWLDGLVLTSDQQSKRKSALAHAFGPPQSRIHGLDRFVKRDGDLSVEVLADPASGARAEVNVARGGALETHQTFSYTPRIDGLTVLRQMHMERRSEIAADVRDVTDVVISRVAINGQEGVR
jgi:hypothetical protein